MAPGANVPKTGTGTVPKSKSRNNSVPREVVAPTRREMQLNPSVDASFDWRPVCESGAPGSAGISALYDFYDDLDSAVSHDNNRFVPVRPQPRSLNLSHQEEEVFHNNSFSSNSPSNMAANTAIVMPTTPGAPRRDSNSYRRDRSCVIFNPAQPGPQGDGASASQIATNTSAKSSNVPVRMPDRQQLEQRLQQIREYLKVTSSLMQTVNDGQSIQTDGDDLDDMARLTIDLRDSEAKILAQIAKLDEPEKDVDECGPVFSGMASEVSIFQSVQAGGETASDHMQRFTNLLDILIHQDQEKYTNMCANYGHSDNDRPPSNLSHASGASSGKNQMNYVNCEETERPLAEQTKFKKKSQPESEAADAPRDSRDTSTIINAICDDLRDLQAISGDHSEATQQGDRQLQAELKAILSSFKATNARDVQATQSSPSRETTPSTCGENVQPTFDTTLSELQDRLSRLRSEGANQNGTGVAQQINSLKILHDRLARLREMADGREELARVLGERDEHLSAEHRALQEKLRDLHIKKEQVEKLVSELQNMASAPSTQEQTVATMRAQLATFQGMLDTVLRTEAEMTIPQQPPGEHSSSTQLQTCNLNKFGNIDERGRNRNVYHPIDFPIENRDTLDEQEDAARGGGRFDKKINKNIPAGGSYERRQMLLKAELQAKKRELEELMRKDQDRTSAINQDVCSETSADKSDTSRYGQDDTLVAQWRDQTLTNRSENEYTSDEEHDSNNESNRFNETVILSNNQLNNISQPGTNTNLAHHLPNVNKSSHGHSQMHGNAHLGHRETTDVSTSSTPEPIPSLWMKSSQSSSQHLNNVNKAHHGQTQLQNDPIPSNVTNHDIADMSVCSGMESMPPSMSPLWRKSSHDGAASASSLPGGTGIRGIWNAPWVNASQRRTEHNSVTVTESMPTLSTTSVRQPTHGSREWWQKKALQLQQQLELTSNLCQSIITDQQAPSSQSPASSVQNDLSPYSGCTCQPVPVVAAPAAFIPIQSQLPLTHQQAYPSTDLQCQNLVAASQLNVQTMLLNSLNQCCHLLWMQQKELTSLRGMMSTLQETTANAFREPLSTSPSQLGSQTQLQGQSQIVGARAAVLQNQTKPHLTQSIIQPNNDANVLYQSNFSYPPQSINTNTNNFNNLQQTSPLANTSNHMQPQNTAALQIQNNVPTQNLQIAQNPNYPAHNFGNNVPLPIAVQNIPCSSPNFTNQNNMVAPIANNLLPLAFPNDNQRPQCVQNIPGSAQVNWNGAQALNNQVPPGNRANNYWDNFRSYSRQNLLSTTATTKSNEGSSHSPSPLVDRSHNMFRTSGIPGPIESAAQAPQPSLPKLNTNPPQTDIKIYRRKKSQMRHSDTSINVNQQNDTSQHHINNQSLINIQNNETATDSFFQQHVNLNQQNLHHQNMDLNSTGGSSSMHPPSNLNLEQLVNGLEMADVRMLVDGTELASLSGSNSDSTKCSKQIQRNVYDRNEWCESEQNDSNQERPKTKLFDILRENVYKEVASLISANETRPHFLIQLFRDLQLISSDGLRHRTLQSIQGVVTDSRASLPDNGQGASRQKNCNGSQTDEIINSAINGDEVAEDCRALNVECTSSIPGDGERNHWLGQQPVRGSKLDREIQSSLRNLIPFLKANAENIYSELMTETIRSLTMQIVPSISSLVEAQQVKNYLTFYQAQLSSLLEEALAKFNGCRLRDISEELLSVLNEILLGELTFILFVDPSCFNNSVATLPINSTDTVENSQLYNPGCESQENSDKNTQQEYNNSEESNMNPESQPVLHNGDLAEADQSHHQNDEEEGAVGGIAKIDDATSLVRLNELPYEDNRGSTEADSEWITFEPGLDCIPSRLGESPITDPVVSSDKPPGRSND